MAQISQNDIVFLLSAPSASGGYSASGAVGNASGSGKFCSTTALGSGLDNLFTDITGAQNAAQQVDYICLFVLNNTASGNSMLNTVAWIPSTSNNTATGASIHKFALDPAGVTAKGSSTAQAALTTSATSAPSGISSWTSASATNSGGLSVGTVAPGDVFAVWFQRTAVNGAPLNSDGFTLEIDFDTQG